MYREAQGAIHSPQVSSLNILLFRTWSRTEPFGRNMNLLVHDNHADKNTSARM